MPELRFFQRKTIRIAPRDNVGVALYFLKKGESVVLEGKTYVLATDVPAKHKFALQDFAGGEEIKMYDTVVGISSVPIPAGGAITTNNIRHLSARFNAATTGYNWNPPDTRKWAERKFLGYPRPDGQVGTRNYWLIVPLVFCENNNIAALRRALSEELGDVATESYKEYVGDLVRAYRKGGAQSLKQVSFNEIVGTRRSPRLFANIDGVRCLTHGMGCGGTRQDALTLCGLLAGYICHPNVAGATVLSLGCQNAEVEILRQEIRKRNANLQKPLLIYDQQAFGAESSMLAAAIQETFLGLARANEVERSPEPITGLTVGLKCGGSDGFSGLSANPTVGHVADIVACLGGKAILSEFPELCGVEQSLIDRCLSGATAEKFIELMQTYATRAEQVHSGFEMNPSPGNIRDGLITDAMKSAGAARKGGSSPIVDVLDYPEYATRAGLNLQCTPGNDVEAVTAQVGAGANIVLFTTGLGTPTGNPIAPVVKISSNSELAAHMRDVVDFDSGPIVRGEKSIQQTGDELLDFALRVASGDIRTKAEIKVQEDFIPWKRGVSL